MPKETRLLGPALVAGPTGARPSCHRIDEDELAARFQDAEDLPHQPARSPQCRKLPGPGDIDLCVAEGDVFVIALEWPIRLPRPSASLVLAIASNSSDCVEGDASAVVLTH